MSVIPSRLPAFTLNMCDVFMLLGSAIYVYVSGMMVPEAEAVASVSYTHLTLPTTPYV